MSLTIEEISVEPPGPGVRLDWAEVFGNDRRVEVELGVGKGGFLLERAREYPETNFLGVEWANKFCRFSADRMARWGVTNVRVMRTDAANLVMHHLRSGSVSALHVYHPDPWPKKRHHKRRLFQPAFVRAVTAALVAGGRLLVQTDHAEYFDWIGDQLAGERDLVVERAGSVDEEAAAEGPGTNYEVKYRRAGRTILALTAVRR